MADIDSVSVGELIFNNLNMMFIEFAKSGNMTIDQLKTSVARQNYPLAKLIEVSSSAE